MRHRSVTGIAAKPIFAFMVIFGLSAWNFALSAEDQASQAVANPPAPLFIKVQFPAPRMTLKKMKLGSYANWQRDLPTAKRLMKDFVRIYAEEYLRAYTSGPVKRRGQLVIDDTVKKWMKIIDQSTSVEDLFPLRLLTDDPPKIKSDLDRLFVATEQLPPSETVGRIYPSPSLTLFKDPRNWKSEARSAAQKYAAEYKSDFEGLRGLPKNVFRTDDLLESFYRQIQGLAAAPRGHEEQDLRLRLKQLLLTRAEEIDMAGYPHLFSWAKQAIESVNHLGPTPTPQQATGIQQKVEDQLKALENSLTQAETPTQTSDAEIVLVGYRSISDRLRNLKWLIILGFIAATGLGARRFFTIRD